MLTLALTIVLAPGGDYFFKDNLLVVAQESSAGGPAHLFLLNPLTLEPAKRSAEEVYADSFVLIQGGAALSHLMAVAGDGSGGRISVSVPNEIRVLMGILENGKGDVCANGAPGRQACLSGLAVKTLTPF